MPYANKDPGFFVIFKVGRKIISPFLFVNFSVEGSESGSRRRKEYESGSRTLFYTADSIVWILF